MISFVITFFTISSISFFTIYSIFFSSRLGPLATSDCVVTGAEEGAALGAGEGGAALGAGEGAALGGEIVGAGIANGWGKTNPPL
ncbi:MAG: hypothetical protein FJX00_02355 [Alphaproteobacteria bacterium]|nr:hypothetical protein [Alphaproteobacteria bacterium]